MRVLHVVGESRFGGGSVMILQLARLGMRMGWAVDVLTTDPALQTLLRQAGAGVVALDAVWRDIAPIRDLKGLYRLFRFLAGTPYMVVHTHTSKGGFVGRLAACVAGVPVVIHTAHGFAFHEYSPRHVVAFYAFLERLASHWCDRIITVSEFHRRWGVRLAVAPERKMIAIPNGIPQTRVMPALDRRAVRTSLGTGLDEVVVLSTGRLAPLKGIEDLVTALAVLRRELPAPVVLWLAGEGPLRDKVAGLAAAQGLSGQVRFLGFRTDIGNLLGASDLVVLPSRREGLSISLLEAMAAGKPIVATTIGSNKEVTRDGDAALLVPPADISALAAAMRRLILEPQFAASLGSKARQIYLSDYTEETMLEKYADEYRRACESAGLNQGAVFPMGAAVRSEPAWKRTMDILGSATLLLILWPIMLMVAALIRLTSPGAALFCQRRLGRYGRPFTMYKFRTMFIGSPDVRNPDGSTFNTEDDPRLTPLGRFLRKTSLDELPQFINVLKGDLSLVGPRPDLPDQLRFYTAQEEQRLEVKPGITGLAQLSGRNSISWERRKQLDIVYLQNRSMLLDLRILLKTVPYVLRRKGIYIQRGAGTLVDRGTTALP